MGEANFYYFTCLNSHNGRSRTIFLDSLDGDFVELVGYLFASSIYFPQLFVFLLLLLRTRSRFASVPRGRNQDVPFELLSTKFHRGGVHYHLRRQFVQNPPEIRL